MADFAETTSAGIAASRPRSASIESRGSWIAAGVSLALLSVSYGSPLLIVVGLKPITEDLGTARQMVALAGALTWLGTGAGGILMGWVAERTSSRLTVIFGTVMIALGLAVSASGNIWAILIGHTLLVGLLGNGALYPPLLVYVSRWFDRRRGTALALISSGQYIAGMAWPILFERAMTDYGWRATMLLGSACQSVAIALFMATQDEAGLFVVSAAYGFGFSGIIPAYVVAIRELFPAREASWRVPMVLFVSMAGMAFGGWFAGALYDHFGFYAPAFLTGVIFNLANLALVGFLVLRQSWSGGLRRYPA